jgi:hypothetical protein
MKARHCNSLARSTPSAPMTGWYFKLSSSVTGFPARGAKQVRVCGFQ